MNADTTKAELRRSILRARREISAEQRRSEAEALLRHLVAHVPANATVCAYVPVGSEPGSREMLDALVAAGVRVLLPVAREVDGHPRPLAWGEYDADGLVEAPFGLREPAPPWLPPEAIAQAALVCVPALAVDRSGVRLGRGAGFYDRSLHLASPTTTLVAVVRDEELVEHLPGEAHDVPMTHALTPNLGLVRLGIAS
ncbi:MULTISPECIES: 5-formyltetrahydrofolate cyclo-ligase [unclassified Mycolicibacterium]|uniref:5-formyltetrahydrofolate cyclo-ligase n=1 Tax=unclassified Mycolicibacterium TaxID=2636767 RepID=UPI001F4C12F4|nr:5-formyltetrahydrofolate cyclo-ligase [Mycolicibacterium sp. YH-1]UNB53922.1 5-formyltetrahydrofolate cyclo-ligase [Mycolicibacterium sp. YH-1]